MDHEIIGGQISLADGTKFPISKAVRAGDFVFLAGQIAFGEDGKLHGEDIETQTRQCIENIQTMLAQTGCELGNIVKATVWLVDKNDFSGFNNVYAEYFNNNPPVRSAVRSDLMLPDALVEIEVVAYRREG